MAEEADPSPFDKLSNTDIIQKMLEHLQAIIDCADALFDRFHLEIYRKPIRTVFVAVRKCQRLLNALLKSLILTKKD